MDVLSQESWRGQEQAALLLGSLDHEPSSGRLLQLLNSERPEVMIASAWALRVLAMPELLPNMLAHAEKQTTLRQMDSIPGLDQQVAHLFEAFGLMHYMPADSLLRQYIPNRLAMGNDSRGAAVWALGHLHAGAPDEDLASLLVARMNAVGEIPPEMVIVFRMSAVTLGRMQTESQLPALRQRLEDTYAYDPVAHAVRWSIHEITGEEIPVLGPVVVQSAGWFLEPIQRDDEENQ
jgi:HEAT repeat protein